MVTDGSHFRATVFVGDRRLAFQSNSVGWRQTAGASGQQFCIETDDDFDWGGPFMRSASRSPFLRRNMQVIIQVSMLKALWKIVFLREPCAGAA